ncbi:hypothetical protein D9611_000893 [Ephemerocybe angulata]|uniref:Uncharacterized protein n=1 Tax=Ephemerocybe angulata TaxID=980116 RepID=A0A8H5F6X1_9AGAR|nr:hypothetical protein D9611_000893 [Tulosesus angulatus]
MSPYADPHYSRAGNANLGTQGSPLQARGSSATQSTHPDHTALAAPEHRYPPGDTMQRRSGAQALTTPGRAAPTQSEEEGRQGLRHQAHLSGSGGAYSRSIGDPGNISTSERETALHRGPESPSHTTRSHGYEDTNRREAVPPNSSRRPTLTTEHPAQLIDHQEPVGSERGGYELAADKDDELDLLGSDMSDVYDGWSDLGSDMSIDSDPGQSGKGKGLAAPFRPPPIAKGSSGSTTYSIVAAKAGTSNSSWGPQAQFSSSSAAPLCIVCKAKPAYSRGYTSYPTCGLKCASVLEQQRPSRQTQAWNHPGMCDVCGVKPKHVGSSGRPYPTCGLTCASALKLQQSKETAVSLCDTCHKFPKRTNGKTTFPQCGRQCRDKAAALAKAMEGTCSICLACWTRPTDSPSAIHCDDVCLAAIKNAGPTLLEIPRGHVLFHKYNTQFLQGWDNSESSQHKAIVRHMYALVPDDSVAKAFDEHKAQLKKSLRGRQLKESERWFSVIRECNTGDSGSINTCSSRSCPFCYFVHKSFTKDRYPSGLSTYSKSTNADDALSGAHQGHTKAMILVKVVHAFSLPESTTPQILSQRRGDSEHSVVRLVSYNRRQKVDNGDLHVYAPAAVLPMGALVYSES